MILKSWKNHLKVFSRVAFVNCVTCSISISFCLTGFCLPWQISLLNTAKRASPPTPYCSYNVTVWPIFGNKIFKSHIIFKCTFKCNYNATTYNLNDGRLEKTMAKTKENCNSCLPELTKTTKTTLLHSGQSRAFVRKISFKQWRQKL